MWGLFWMKNFFKDRQPWSSGALSWVFSSLSMTNRIIIKIIIIHLLIIIIIIIIIYIWSDHFKNFRPPVHCYSQCGICCSQDSVNMNLKFSHKSPRVGGNVNPKRNMYKSYKKFPFQNSDAQRLFSFSKFVLAYTKR